MAASFRIHLGPINHLIFRCTLVCIAQLNETAHEYYFREYIADLARNDMRPSPTPIHLASVHTRSASGAMELIARKIFSSQ
jgi:hypothetical protein